MAQFEEHLGWAVGGGVFLAIAGLRAHHIQPWEALVVVALAGLGGSIPDIDKNDAKAESKPFKYFTGTLGVAAPFFIVDHLKPGIAIDPSTEIMLYLILSAIIYLSVRWLIRNTTRHRGVMHSIPFAVLSGQLTYLLFISDYFLLAPTSPKMPTYFAMAVFVGYLTHLLADELHSLYNFKDKKFEKKSSFRTAFTLYTGSKTDPDATARANTILYLLVIVCFFAIQSRQVSLQSLMAMLITPY